MGGGPRWPGRDVGVQYVLRGIYLSPMGLALTLKRLRKVQGLTQQALAVKAGISLGYLSRLEVGTHDPRLSMLRKLAKALGVPVSALLDAPAAPQRPRKGRGRWRGWTGTR